MTNPAGTYVPAPAADFVLPFSLPKLGMRGSLVRLDAVSSQALSAHVLPEPVQRIVAEGLALTALLGSLLKLEGRLSLQTKSNGPMDLLATDFFAGGGLRGYARLREGVKPLPQVFAELAGEGSLAITIEHKPGGQTYQGLVPLAPEGLGASAEQYFEQSEQLPTMLRLAAGPAYSADTGYGWRAGGLLVQALPGSPPGELKSSDDWQRVGLFVKSLADLELLDTALKAEDVLWRLFHEDEVRVHGSEAMRFQCSCRPERIEAVLKSYPRSELLELRDPDGAIRARCEFCGTVHAFEVDKLAP